MTTTVTIKAHCSTDKEVHVRITCPDNDNGKENFVLLDGEEANRVVYDDREIHIKEVAR